MSTIVSTRTPGTLNPTRQQLDELDALLKRMLELPVNQLDDTDDEEAEEVADDLASPPSFLSPPKERESRNRPMESKPAAPPVSYMVVETASPRPLPAASGFETRPAVPMPRPAPVTPARDESFEEEASLPAAAPEPMSMPMPIEDSSSTEAEVWVPLRSTWQPSAQTWQPLAESWQQANGATPAPAPLPIPITPPPVAVAPPTPEPTETAPRPAPMAGPTPSRSESPTGVSPVPAVPAAVEPRLSLSAEDAPVSAPPLLMPLVWFNQGFDACVAPLGDLGRWLSGPKGRQTLGMAGLLCLAAATVIALSAGMGWTW
jgi:hypothetical protein